MREGGIPRVVRIAGVSDVVLGYGSPQIPSLLCALAEHYQVNEALLLEPSATALPPRNRIAGLPCRLTVETIKTRDNPHQRAAGRIEYVCRAARRINAFRPEIVVVFCTYSLPALFKLQYRPALTIYHSIETIAAYGAFDVQMNRCLSGLVDLVIFPEENRAIVDTRRCGFHGIPKVIMYNVSNSGEQADAMLPPGRRSGRVLCAGTIDRHRTFASWFLDVQMRGVPVDLCGRIGGWENPSQFVNALPPSMRYFGLLDGPTCRKMLKDYAYSLVVWNPVDENTLFAAPNKLFESISAGVPPICAPHPLCKLLLDRYQCGILMKDWTFLSFYEAIQRGLRLVGTSAYDRMVANCAHAVEQELNWNAQWGKVKRLLPEVL
jgi:hypothetical protein